MKKIVAVKLIAEKEVPREWFTQQAAADYLGMSLDYIKTIRKSGALRYYQPNGKAIFIAKRDLDNYIRRHPYINTPSL